MTFLIIIIIVLLYSPIHMMDAVAHMLDHHEMIEWAIRVWNEQDYIENSGYNFHSYKMHLVTRSNTFILLRIRPVWWPGPFKAEACLNFI
jgi:hypothetical protein